MNNEELVKWLPVLGTGASIIGGLILSSIEDRRQAIKERSVSTDAQSLVNAFAASAKEEIRLLTERVQMLEDEGRAKDQHIASLERRIDLYEQQINVGTQEKEIDLESEMG